MIKKSFIAISSVIDKNKLKYLCASSGESLYLENGIKFDKAIEFLFDLIKHRNKKQGIIFVCYAFARDNEFIFSTMPAYLRHRLFQSRITRNEIEPLKAELEQTDDVFYNAKADSQTREQANFDRYVLKHAISEALEVQYKEYKITLRQGKILTITRKGKSISFYDIYGFFKKQTLRQSCNTWLEKDILALDKEVFCNNPLFEQNKLQQLKIFAQMEAGYTAQLAGKLNKKLQTNNINLTRFYGASCVISHFLNKWKAKENFHNYRYPRQMSELLWNAHTSAFYGGRIEQLKLGTIKDVNIYDINSAYSYASMFLPEMKQKPYFAREWKPEPFSLWFAEYDFTSLNSYIGFLPFRAWNNSIKFPLKASGWFWQPELDFIIQNYPQCIDVKHGFVLPYKKQVSFAPELQKLYDLRLKLKQENNPLEKIIKLALSNINGRFSQNISKQRYYNLFYAGFVTSVTRRQLLQAVKGKEAETVCFQTDAIHTTADLSKNISVSNEIGDFKVTHYDNVLYLDNGVYQAFSDGVLKKAKTRGLKTLDFQNALSEMQDNYSYDAESDVFIGHNLYTAKTFNKAEYLDILNIKRSFSPSSEIDSRVFEKKKINLLDGFLDSLPITEYSGNSQKFKEGVVKGFYQTMDSLEVARV